MTFNTLISTSQLANHLGEWDFVIVDCRHNLVDVGAGERAYREAHLPSAYFLHLDRDLSGQRTGNNGRHPLPNPEVLARKLGALGISAEKQVVAYDQNNGMFAVRLWWLLRWLGHRAAAVLDGGLDKWIQESRPISAEIPRVKSTEFVIKLNQSTVDTNFVESHLGSPAMTLVDARAADRFRGENETLDPVGGHIPGAINRPFATNLHPDGTWKSSEQLRAEFAALLPDKSPQTVIHQCGSGVTACHNLLAMEIAGLSGSRLYPGSWSEWCSDPARPIAR